MRMRKNLILAVFMLVLAVGSAAAQQPSTGNSAVLPNPGLTPGNPFYFLDKFGEALREFFTFNPEGKARLQVVFAAERIAEIKIVLESRGVDAPGLETAKVRLRSNIARAAGIVESEKLKGRDVKKLAGDLDDEFDSQENALKSVFKEQKESLKALERELKDKIKIARKAGDASQLETLINQLRDVKAQRESFEAKEDEIEDGLEQEQDRLKKELEKKTEAEKAIRNAEEEKREVLDKAAEEGVSVPVEAFAKFDQLLSQANELFVKENYVGAKQLAKQAEKSLDKVEDIINDLDKAKEKEEELKEEQAERLEKKIEKEVERLEKERRKAGEETRQLEDLLRKAGEIEEEGRN